MKMSKTLYAELKSDIETLAQSLFGDHLEEKQLTSAFMWLMFHKVAFQRMNDDSHPNWNAIHDLGAKGRVLAMWSKDGKATSRNELGNDNWLNRFYVDEELNDNHIETALRAIAKEMREAIASKGDANDVQAHDYGDSGAFFVTYCTASGQSYLTDVNAVDAVALARATGNKVSELTPRLWLELALSQELDAPATDAEVSASHLHSVIFVQNGTVIH